MKLHISKWASFGIALLLGMTSCSSSQTTTEPSTSSSTEATEESTSLGTLKITFLDVKKADCMVIETPNHTVVIDTATKKKGDNLVDFLRKENIYEIDCLILTHYDEDHIGGAKDLINSFTVDSVYAPNAENTSSEYATLQNCYEEKNITPNLLTEDVSFTFDDASFTIYAPQRDNYGKDDDNDFSLVTSLIYGEDSFLFCGDATEARLQELMDLSSYEVMKVPYHGRQIANFEEFATLIQPKYAIISSIKSEISSSTLNALEATGARVLRTDQDGTITMTSYGTGISVTTEK